MKLILVLSGTQAFEFEVDKGREWQVVLGYQKACQRQALLAGVMVAMMLVILNVISALNWLKTPS